MPALFLAEAEIERGWLIVSAHQFVAIDYLNHWRFSHNAAAVVKRLMQNANGRS